MDNVNVLAIALYKVINHLLMTNGIATLEETTIQRSNDNDMSTK